MKTFIVDSFTNTLFRGNPAGVCIVDQPLSDATMLNIAQELNLSETAFIKATDGHGNFEIRFFSPKMEIPLCGHATLASARVASTTFDLKEAQFKTIENVVLPVQISKDAIRITFPVYETSPAQPPASLLAALGLDSVQNSVFNEQTKILLLEISDTQALANLTPDFEALVKSHQSIHGVLVTAPSTADGFDFHSRYFWPWSGTNEDPVTGGTHTFLAKYWSVRLGKTKMKSFQSSKRTGSMEVELLGEKLIITSQAIIVLEGNLFL
jgi:PhzF family phenazine biosynthesis protein